MPQVFVFLFVSCTALVARESRATLTGTVVDPQGAAIPAITARNLATNIEVSASSNEAGLYVLPFLNTGTYTVTVAPGFKSAMKDRVELGLGQRHQLDFTMEIGVASEQVTVTAEVELLNTANAIRGTAGQHHRSSL